MTRNELKKEICTLLNTDFSEPEMPYELNRLIDNIYNFAAMRHGTIKSRETVAVIAGFWLLLKGADDDN